MAARIQQALGVEAQLIAGGGGVFDVAVNHELVFSKFRTGTYPDEAQLVKELVATYESSSSQ